MSILSVRLHGNGAGEVHQESVGRLEALVGRNGVLRSAEFGEVQWMTDADCRHRRRC
jgi:hypothetical protein